MKLKTIIIITAVIPIIVIGYLTLPWILISFYGEFVVPEPAKPQITQESFPFTLVYESGGEEKVIEDTMLCKYTGSEWPGTGETKVRTWEMELASGGDAIVLWEGKSKKGKEQKVIWGVSPEYYMGDMEDKSGYMKPDEDDYFYPGMTEEEYLNIYVEVRTMSSDGVTEDIIGRKKLQEKYGIKIVRWECRQPIQNEFTKGQ